eukprot:jgi/Hompol1/2238/HPOL_002160-RA
MLRSILAIRAAAATAARPASRSHRHLATFAQSTVGLKRSARDVALRTASTQLLLSRWAIEASSLQDTDPEAKERAQIGFKALSEAIDKSGFVKHMTATEQELQQRPFGGWTPSEVMGLHSRWESFGVLLWTLRIFRDIPQYPDRFPSEQLYKTTAIIPAFPQTIDLFVEYFTSGEGSKENHIVARGEFETAINRAEAWYWRSRAQTVLELKLGLQGDSEQVRQARKRIPSGLRNVMDSIERAISQASQRALADGHIAAIIDDDFGVGSVGFRNLDDHALRDMDRMTETRLAALAWLAGAADWEFVTGEVQFINPLGSLWSPESE